MLSGRVHQPSLPGQTTRQSCRIRRRASPACIEPCPPKLPFDRELSYIPYVHEIGRISDVGLSLRMILPLCRRLSRLLDAEHVELSNCPGKSQPPHVLTWIPQPTTQQCVSRAE